MAYEHLDTLIVATTADGAGDVLDHTDHTQGRLAMIRYDGGHGATAVLQITAETSGQVLWSQAVAAGATVYPAVPMHDTAGAEIAQRDYAWLIQERIQIAVAGATPDSTATFVFAWAGS